MEKKDVIDEGATCTSPKKQDIIQEKQETPFMKERKLDEQCATDPFQTGLEAALASAASPSLPEEQDDHVDDNDKDFSIDTFSNVELAEYKEAAIANEVLKEVGVPKTSSPVSDRVWWHDGTLQGQKHTDTAEQKPEPGSLRVQIPSPESSGNLNTSHPQHHSPLSRPKRANSPHFNTLDEDTSPNSFHSFHSSLSVIPNQHSSMEPIDRSLLWKLTADQQVELAARLIKLAKDFLVKAKGTEEQRVQAFDVAIDAENVKTQAMPASSYNQECLTGGMSLEEKKPLRKKLSSIFKKTPSSSEVNLTSKSSLVISAPIVEADNKLNSAKFISKMNLVSIALAEPRADISLDEGTSTAATAEHGSTSAQTQPIPFNEEVPPVPPIPKRPTQFESPEEKKHNRDIHVYGNSPNDTVIIDNSNAYYSPGRRRLGASNQSASRSFSASTMSAHERHPQISSAGVGQPVPSFHTDEGQANQSANEQDATPSTPTNKHKRQTKASHAASKRPEEDSAVKEAKHPANVDEEEHAIHSVNNQNDASATPTRKQKRHRKVSHAAGKRPEQRSILKKDKQGANVDEEDNATTPTQDDFNPSDYSGDENSVHTAKVVPIVFSGKAKLVDIPARRGPHYPATIDRNDPRNMALFSNPPDNDLLMVERKAEALKVQREQAAADEAKRAQDASAKPKTKGAFANLKNAFKPKENKHDEGEGEGENGTARGRMEGY